MSPADAAISKNFALAQAHRRETSPRPTFMFLTVTPNLCIERTLQIPDFRAGAVHRVAPENLSVNAGGKGINAARVARELGARVLALSWVGTNQRAWFEAELSRENIAFDFVEVESDTRVCVNILGEGGGKTEVVEAGHALSISDGERMRNKFESLLPLAELVAICGSYPSGSGRSTPPAFPADLISLCGLAHEHGKKVLVDGKGAEFSALLHLQSNAQVLPFAIKPNCDEASVFLEYSVHDESSERRAIRDFLELKIEVVLLSCGARGAYWERARVLISYRLRVCGKFRQSVRAMRLSVRSARGFWKTRA